MGRGKSEKGTGRIDWEWGSAWVAGRMSRGEKQAFWRNGWVESLEVYQRKKYLKKKKNER